MRYVLPIVLASLLMSACGGVKHTTSTAGHPRPGKANTFSYKKKGFRLTSNIIDTNDIYCYSYGRDNPEYFECYRFFATGQVVYQSFYTKTRPFSVDSFANTNTGYVGYYHIEDSIVRLQILFAYPGFKSDGSGRGQIDHRYGTITGSGINFYAENTSKHYRAGRLIKHAWYKHLKGGRLQPFVKMNVHPKWVKVDW